MFIVKLHWYNLEPYVQRDRRGSISGWLADFCGAYAIDISTDRALFDDVPAATFMTKYEDCVAGYDAIHGSYMIHLHLSNWYKTGMYCPDALRQLNECGGRLFNDDRFDRRILIFPSDREALAFALMRPDIYAECRDDNGKCG